MRMNGAKCSLCGEAATAVWHGCETVAACPDCAVNVLPALIADAVFVPTGPVAQDTTKRTLEQVGAAYWRAMTSRLLAELKAARQKGRREC